MKKFKVCRKVIKCRNCGAVWPKVKPPGQNPIHTCSDPISTIAKELDKQDSDDR